MGNISPLLENNAKHGKILSMAGKLAFDEKIPAYVVGGYVRDMLLGRSSNDIDIMVEGDGIEFAKKLSKILHVDVTVDYEKFGTALIPHPDLEIEVASARKEKYETYSRIPKITPASVEEDMSRRDFTINAISASIRPRRYKEMDRF